MPNHWLSTRGQTGLGLDESRSRGRFEPTRRDDPTSKQAETTSSPTIHSQDVEKFRSKRSFSRTRADVDRSRTAGGAVQSTSSAEIRLPPRTTSRAYVPDSQRPPVQPLDLKTAYCMDEDMIGMALGSPSHPPFPQSNVHDQLQPAAADTRAHGYREAMAEAKSANPKAGKWKMFGGLFKPKYNSSTQAAPAAPQLSPHQDAERNTDTTESRPLPLSKDTPPTHRTSEQPASAPRDYADAEDVKDDAPGLLRAELPKLEVDIPDVQMDRYSVMFGNLLGGQQSGSLLSRRSKVLQRLNTSSNENDASQEPLPQDKQPENAGLPSDAVRPENYEQLKPSPSARRATTPTPGKSPIFSLFPQPPATPRRAAAMTSQARPSPLQRSFTAPSRLSPMEETFGTKTPQAVKPSHVKRRKSSISLVETSASTAQGPGWSTDGSYLSPNSSVSSVGDEILFDIKKLSMVTENQEPQYEVTKPDGETVELYRALSKKVKATKPPMLKLSSKYAKAEPAMPSAPKANESMLRSSDAAARANLEGSNDVPVTTKSKTSEYLLPSTHFIPIAPTVEAAKQRSTPAPKPSVVSVSKPPTEVKDRPIPQPSQTTMSVSDSPVEMEESVEASQDILAAAVMGTLDHMGEQSSLRAASPMPELPEERAATPVEKPVKLLVIPKNIPISKYSLRSPTASQFKDDIGTRSSSPQPRRAVTEPLVHDQSFAARATKLQAAPAVPNSRAKKNATKPNSSSKVVPAQAKGNNKTRGPKPELSIVAPKPAAAIESPNSALSPVEVTVARQVSLARQQSKRLLIPPPGRRLEGLATDDGEKVVHTQALMPVIVDANKAHRPGKSLALVIENA